MAFWGVASTGEYRERFPEASWIPGNDLPRAVVLGYPLLSGVLNTLVDQPTHIYFHHYRQVNFWLDRLALTIGQALEDAGFQAVAVAASQTLDDEDRIAHLSHRHLAFLAGLGWRGKNNLLVNRQLGSRFRLVSVLTDAPLEPGTALESEGCGSCTLCARSCPAGAIGETARQFDLDKCAGVIDKFRRIQRIGQRICGVCQKACIKYGWPRNQTGEVR